MKGFFDKLFIYIYMRTEQWLNGPKFSLLIWKSECLILLPWHYYAWLVITFSGPKHMDTNFLQKCFVLAHINLILERGSLRGRWETTKQISWLPQLNLCLLPDEEVAQALPHEGLWHSWRKKNDAVMQTKERPGQKCWCTFWQTFLFKHLFSYIKLIFYEENKFQVCIYCKP